MQRACLSDPLLIQFHAGTTATYFRLHFYNESGQKVTTRVVTSGHVNITGNTAQDAAGNTVALRTFTRLFSFAWEDLAEGIYTVVCEVNDGTYQPGGAFPAVVRYLISEPLWVKKKWPNTSLLSYRNRINEANFVWEQTGVTGSLRVTGGVREGEMDSVTESYKEGDYNPVQLSSHPSTTYELSTVPLPLFLREKLNRIFACSDVAIDGRVVVKTGKPQQSDNTTFLRTFSQTFESRNEGSEWLSGKGWGGVAMWMRTSDLGQMALPNLYFPYVVAALRVGSTTHALSLLVEEAADVEGAVEALNSKTLSTYGLQGFFEARDGVIGYVSNGIEGLRDVELILLSDHVELVSSSGLPGTTLTVVANGERVAIQPDKGSKTLVLTAFNSTPASTQALSHTYAGFPTVGPPAARVFTGRKATQVEVVWPITPLSNIKARTGLWTAFSAELKHLATFPVERLWSAAATLETVELKGDFLAAVSGFNHSWARLKNVSVKDSALTSLSVNAILSDLGAYVLASGVQNGTIDLSGQTPAAPPGTFGAATIAYLQSQGWTVTTD